MSEKVVFILGAGFSYPAKIPTQNSLLKNILEYDPGFEAPEFPAAKEKLKVFLENIFPDPKLVDIEDLFTILDRASNEKERFTTYTWDDLNELRNDLIYLILYIIDASLKEVDMQHDSYRKFIEYLVYLREDTSSNVAVISTNWDNLLERFLENFSTENEEKKIRTDYCVYTYKLDGIDHIPHITLKAKGYENIKLLKLHGSINWLYCSQCKRMYIDNDSISIEKKQCRFCNKTKEGEKNTEEEQSIYIEPIIITPTLLKEYHNLYIQGIWQNAFIELQEATKVIFIGYSLPKIDFELKYILKKAIGKDMEVEVVLAQEDENEETHKNYKRLFGIENVTYHFCGFEEWVSKIRH